MVHMNEPQTDEEKIEWLWNRVDRLQSENIRLKEENAAMSERISEMTESIMQMSKDIATMAIELNAARSAARDSVIEYIAAQGE